MAAQEVVKLPDDIFERIKEKEAEGFLKRRADQVVPLTKKWEKVLKAFSPGQRKAEVMAVTSENQSLITNYLRDEARIGEWMIANHVELSQRMWHYSVLTDLVSVQPMFGPCDLYTMFDAAGRRQTEAVASKVVKRRVVNYATELSFGRVNGIDASQELLSVMAAELSLEMDRAVVDAIRAKAARRVVGYDEFRSNGANRLIEEIAESINTTGGRGPGNWIITSPDLAWSLGWYKEGDNRDEFSLGLMITERSRIENKIRVFTDPLLQTNRIIIGRLGDRIGDSGLIYCPYMLMFKHVDDPNMFMARTDIASREGMVWAPEGEKQYLNIEVTGYQE